MIAQLDARTVRGAPGRAAARLVSYALFEGRPALTRGRWINPLVRANLRLGSRVRRGHTITDPIFIVGIGRSGTTLLGQILATHPQVGYLNEPKAMWHQVNPADDIIGSYSQDAGRLLLTETDVSGEGISQAHAMYSWYLACTRSSRVVDKYPELVYRQSLVTAIFPDARFIAILRHPWDVVRSITTWNELRRSQDSDWWGVRDRKWWTLWNEIVSGREQFRWLTEIVDPLDATDAERAAVEWYLGTSAARRLDSAHVVFYDELLCDPRRVLTGIMEAVDLPVVERVIEIGEAVVHRPPPHRSAPSDLCPILVERCDGLYAELRS